MQKVLVGPKKPKVSRAPLRKVERVTDTSAAWAAQQFHERRMRQLSDRTSDSIVALGCRSSERKSISPITMRNRGIAMLRAQLM
jgi:hypothetical protein